MASWWNKYNATKMKAILDALYGGSAGHVLTAAGNGATPSMQAPAGGGGATPATYLHQSTVTLTDTQIKALPSLGITVADAPGADCIIELVSASWIFDTTAGAYDVRVNASWSLLLGTREITAPCNAFGMTSASVKFGVWLPVVSGPGADDFTGLTVTGTQGELAAMANEALKVQDFYQGVVDYTGGHASNTLRVNATYLIRNTLTGALVAA